MADSNEAKLDELQFTQAEGLQKTYAHYLLFKNDSPTLGAILNIVVPDKVELFKNIFTELNKKHVNAGLKQFAPNFLSAKIQTWEKNKYGITYEQYAEMRKYVEILNVFRGADKMAKEMYENKFLIDTIHEAVIQYFPANDAVSKDNNIIQTARANLQKSLKQGYIGTTRSEYIKPLDSQLTNIAALKGEIDKIKTNVFDNLPNVLHLEAIAELHRRAFLTVSEQDRNDLEVIAQYKSTPPSNPPQKSSGPPLSVKQSLPSTGLEKSAPQSYGGGKEENYGKKKDGTGIDPDNWPTTIIELNGWIKKQPEYAKDSSQPTLKGDKKYVKTSIGYPNIENEVKIYDTIGDGTCLLHAIFMVTCEAYRTTQNKEIICNRFRTEKFGLLPYTYGGNDINKTTNENIYDRSRGENGDGKKDGKYIWLTDDDAKAFCMFFNINLYIFGGKNGDRSNDIIDGDNYYFIYNSDGVHFEGMSTTNDEWTVVDGRKEGAVKWDSADFKNDGEATEFITNILNLPNICVEKWRIYAAVKTTASGGGTNKKLKTRKPRIFKKWKSRRRRM